MRLVNRENIWLNINEIVLNVDLISINTLKSLNAVRQLWWLKRHLAVKMEIHSVNMLIAQFLNN